MMEAESLITVPWYYIAIVIVLLAISWLVVICCIVYAYRRSRNNKKKKQLGIHGISNKKASYFRVSVCSSSTLNAELDLTNMISLMRVGMCVGGRHFPQGDSPPPADTY